MLKGHIEHARTFQLCALGCLVVVSCLGPGKQQLEDLEISQGHQGLLVLMKGYNSV